MNVIAERIIFMLIFFQVGYNIVGVIQIVPGIAFPILGNSFNIFSTTEAIHGITDAYNNEQTTFTALFAGVSSTPITLIHFFGSDLNTFTPITEIVGYAMLFVNIAAASMMLGAEMGMLIFDLIYQITIGAIPFYASLFGLVDVRDEWIFGALIGGVQCTIVLYYLADYVVNLAAAIATKVEALA